MIILSRLLIFGFSFLHSTQFLMTLDHTCFSRLLGSLPNIHYYHVFLWLLPPLNNSPDSPLFAPYSPVGIGVRVPQQHQLNQQHPLVQANQNLNSDKQHVKVVLHMLVMSVVQRVENLVNC